MESIIKGKWIYFAKISEGKTYVFNVCTMEGVKLGEIKWYPQWRKYAFFPNPKTLYEQYCLSDISKFMDRLMNDRKVNLQNAKQKEL